MRTPCDWVAVIAATALLACGDPPSRPDPEPLDAEIALSPDSQAVWAFDTLVITVSFTGPDRDRLMMLPVSWMSSDSSVVEVLAGPGGSALAVPRRAGEALVVARAGQVADTTRVVGWEEGEPLFVREWVAAAVTYLLSPAVTPEGTVYLLRPSPGAVVAYDADLELAWEVATANPGWINVAITDDGTIVVPGGEAITGLSAAGATAWRDTAFGALEAAPAIDGQGHVWLAGQWNLPTPPPPPPWGLAHYDASGVRVGFTETGLAKIPPTVVGDSVVVIGNLGSEVFGISRGDSVLWRDTLPSTLRYSAPSAAGDGRTVYLPAAGNVIAMDALSGMVLWSWDSPTGLSYPLSPIVDADGSIYVQTTATLMALRADGSIRWQADSLRGGHGPNARSAPALAGGGILYVACVTDLCAVNTADGSVRWRRPLPVGVAAGSIAGTIMVLPDSSILFSTLNMGVAAPSHLVRLRGRFPLADAPWPVDGGNLRRTRRGLVP